MGWLGCLLGALAGCSREPPFVRDGDGWRYRGHLLDVDAASFGPLGAHYARDATQAIYADTYRDSRDYFTTARLRVTRIAGADLASFAVLDDDHARDARHAYYEGRPFAVKDLASFVLLDHGFARDRVAGYWQRAPVNGSHGESFAALGPHHAGDARHVWWCEIDLSRSGPGVPRCTLLPGAEPSRFEVLGRGYARSGARVFHRANWLSDADAASFVVDESYRGTGDAQDTRGGFADGRRLAAAAASR